MKALKVISTFLFIVILVFLSFNALVPANYKVKRTINLESTTKDVFNYYRNPSLIQDWNALLQNETINIVGEDGNKGCKIETRTETWEITKLEPTKYLEYEIESKKNENLKYVSFTFEEQNSGGVEVTIQAEGKHQFLKRFQNLRMDKKLNTFLDSALIKGASYLYQ